MCKGLEVCNNMMDMEKLQFCGIPPGLLLPTSFLSQLWSEPMWSWGAGGRCMIAGVLSLPGEGWEAALLGGAALGIRSLGGLLSLLPLTTRKEAEGGCPVALWLGSAVLPIMMEDPFQEQTNHRAGGSGRIGRYWLNWQSWAEPELP